MPTSPRPLSERPFPWARVALVWAGVALFLVVYSASWRMLAGAPALTVGALVQGLHWLSWTLATPFMVWAARRFPLIHGRRGQRVVVHAALAATISVALSALNVAVAQVVGYLDEPGALTTGAFAVSILVSSLVIDLHVYTAVIAVVTALDGRRRSDLLEAQLAQAQLRALRSQLNPHFLFNALQTVSALTSPADYRARRVLSDLGDLLRLSLERANAHEVSLDEELSFLERYLAIERVRFEDRLTVDVDVDGEARDAAVPSLILQPLVENAVKHGVAPREGPVHIEVSARRIGDRLTLRVADDGGAESGPATASMGVGLANVEARLRALYGPAATFHHGPADGRGYVVCLDLPFRLPTEPA